MSEIQSAHTRQTDPALAAADLAASITGFSPTAIIFFASRALDGRALSAELVRRFPAAQVIGCTTAGEFTARAHGTGAASLLALGPSKVRRAAATIAELGGDIHASIASATRRLGAAFDVDVREADPARYVGVVLCDGIKMHEEEVNAALGNAAPMLSFVGGSAGDDLAFAETRVYVNGEASTEGAALLLLDAAVPFAIGKTCSFVPTDRSFTVTRADPAKRTVYELDHAPVLPTYAAAVGATVEKLPELFMERPLGLVIDDKPWIRAPHLALPDGGLRCHCQILEGMEVHVMQSTDLIQDTREEMSRIRATLGGRLSGGLAFNCILRRLELDAKNLHGPFLESFAGLEVAGFHTYGESWLGHMNHTLTALWFA
jgi:hypothetical protein